MPILEPGRSKPSRCCTPLLLLLASTWLPHALAATDARAARGEATGKITRSPVVGPRAPDGTMGGTIPSAVPGWTPNPADARDAYVYVPQEGWRRGDTRQERQERSPAGDAPGGRSR